VKVPRPSQDDKAYFLALVPNGPNIEVQPMFGNLGAFVNGNMFMGLLGCDVGVKLEAADLARLVAEPGAGPFGPAERPMAGYVTIPSSWRARPEKATPWIAKALARSAALPTKQATARRR